MMRISKMPLQFTSNMVEGVQTAIALTFVAE
jgi:hypothetical protein